MELKKIVWFLLALVALFYMFVAIEACETGVMNERRGEAVRTSV
jgi:hypothetical protein